MEYGNSFLSPSQGIFENIKVNYRRFSFANSSLEPTKWQLVARKTSELVGYQAQRPAEAILSQNFVQFDGSYSR